MVANINIPNTQNVAEFTRTYWLDQSRKMTWKVQRPNHVIGTAARSQQPFTKGP
jgi:hypothetical protein